MFSIEKISLDQSKIFREFLAHLLYDQQDRTAILTKIIILNTKCITF